MSAASRYRSLNLAQTLDELLGSKDASDRNSLSSPARPPTRHGRESAGSSNEENKDPSPKSPNVAPQIQTIRFHEGPSRQDSKESLTEEDDFLSKLNALRRRSVVTSADVLEKKTNGEDRKNRLSSGIKEESEDEKHEQTISRRPSSSSSAKTFRINHLEAIPPLEIKSPEPPKVVKQAPKPPPVPIQKPATSSSYRPRVFDDSGHSKWLMKKEEELMRKRKEEAEKEEKKKKELEEKKHYAKMTFERWRQNYDEKLKEKRKEQKVRERAQSASKERQEKTKKEDAQKTFEAWKKDRARSLNSRKKREEGIAEQKRKQKEEDERIKKEEAEKAFQAWKSKKEAHEEEQKRMLERKMKMGLDRKKLEDEYKDLVAQQAFETWMELKDVQYQQEQIIQDVPVITRNIPWMPPSNTVPRQFTPGRNRRRSLDRKTSMRVNSSSLTRRANSAKSVKF